MHLYIEYLFLKVICFHYCVARMLLTNGFPFTGTYISYYQFIIFIYW